MATPSVRPYPSSFTFLPFLTTYRKSETSALPISPSADAAPGPDSKYFCERCGQVELYDLSLECLKEWGYGTEYGLSELTLVVVYPDGRRKSRDNCSFCWVDRTEDWVPVRLKRLGLVRCLYEALATSGRLTTVLDLHNAKPQRETRVQVYVCAYGTGGLLKPQPVPPLCDPFRARLWLNNCKMFHGAACNQRASTVRGMQLLDCDRLKVVKAHPSWAWLALSYVWGKDDSATDDSIEGTPGNKSAAVPWYAKFISHLRRRSRLRYLHQSSQLPNTVKDAVTITKKLGYRYLWVDQLCINQEDGAHKEQQIRNMDKIYQGADMTLVAAGGDSKHAGIAGIGAQRKSQHKMFEADGDRAIYSSMFLDPIADVRYHSVWWTRAWT